MNTVTSEKRTIPYYNEMRKERLFPHGQKVSIGKNKPMRDEFIHVISHNDLSDSDYLAKTLRVQISNDEATDMGALIEKFPNLEKLSISRNLIPFKKINLDKLKGLSLTAFYGKRIENEHGNNLWLKEQIMPNVEFLRCFDNQRASDFCGITPENVPNLNWLECTIDNKKEVLKAIQKFKNVTALQASNVGKQDIFEAFENRLQLLDISGRFAGFPMDKISSQTSLEFLWINSYKKEFDMEWLMNLNLKEIQLLNCPNVINAEALLEMNSLKSLHILNCKNALSSELKLELKDREFEYLEIDFT